jgi:hypothetical protein
VAWRLTAVLVLASATVAFAASPAATPGPDTLRGTAEADTLRGRGGDDELLGRRGDDRLAGGAGDDLLLGGAGLDSMAGGRGEDECLTDAADPMPSDCEDVGGPAGPLRIEETTGTDRCLVLRRAELCYFLLEGEGADAESGAIAADGGVRLTSEPDLVEAREGAWTAHGTYACEGDGELAVTIAADTAVAAVDC